MARTLLVAIAVIATVACGLSEAEVREIVRQEAIDEREHVLDAVREENRRFSSQIDEILTQRDEALTNLVLEQQRRTRDEVTVMLESEARREFGEDDRAFVQRSLLESRSQTTARVEQLMDRQSDRVQELLDGYADDLDAELTEVWDYLQTEDPATTAICQLDQWVTSLWLVSQLTVEHIDTGTGLTTADKILSGEPPEDLRGTLCHVNTDGVWVLQP